MFKKFADQHFSGDKDSAVKCIAHEMATVKYEKTENTENCRSMFSELEDKDKLSLYDQFMEEHSLSDRIGSTVSDKKTLTSDDESAKLNKIMKSAQIKMIFSILGCVISIILAGFVLMTKEDFLIRYIIVIAPIVPIMAVIMVQRIMIHLRYQKITEYLDNRDFLEEQIKGLR